MSSPAPRSPAPPAEDRAAALCHALRVRLPGPPADAEDVFRTAATAWWPDSPPRLWLDPVPAVAGSPMGERRLRSERLRPIEQDGPVLRAVCLVYSDGPADLVLVARRSVLDATSLRHIADVVAGTIAAAEIQPPTLPPMCSADGETLATDGVAETGWATSEAGAGDRTGQVSVVLGGEHPDAIPALAVAAGIVLGRYTEKATSQVLLSGAPADRPANTLGSFDGLSALTLDLSGETNLGELVSQVAQAAHGDPVTAKTEPALAIFASGNDVQGYDVQEYLACQAPVCPLTLVPRGTGDRLTVAVHHRLREIDRASATRFAAHLAHVHAQLLANDPARDPRDLDLVGAAPARGGRGG
ncbi:hypothetical protein, partial [Amycolatopsis sp. NPDC059021]|uniref:hypothetical protein n=1 Tax=Amycolatopsis sp. NPDC059021 TaxID=3346704 RepID=UPI00366DBBDC